MPDTVPHLGMLNGDDYPLGVVQNMSILPSAGRETNVTGFRLDRLAVRIGLEMACIVLRAILFVADLITVGIVCFSFHVTPHITDLPTEATLSTSYSA